jgi:spermidine synthase
MSDDVKEISGENDIYQPVYSINGLRLFLLGFLTLFLELALIRYLAGNIWNLGYFPNLVLISVFIGMGLGFVFHNYVNNKVSNILFQTAFVLILLLAAIIFLRNPFVPGFGKWYGNFGGDIYFSSIPFNIEKYSNIPFISCFAILIIIFGFISQKTAKIFRLFDPLSAYTLDIAGSCLGILAFMIISYLQLSAHWWFIVPAIILPLTMETRWQFRFIPSVLCMLVSLISFQQDTVLMENHNFKGHHETHWSPYQKVEYIKGGGKKIIFVNGLSHQEILNEPSAGIYQIPYSLRKRTSGMPPYKKVLIIGSGSGNDVVVALQNNVEHVDAVEIDPVIAELATKYSPYKVYNDPRVKLYIKDGREFMTNTKEKYDLIVFALTDSLVKVSPLSQLRLENYLFTVDSIYRANDLLNENGNIVLYNFYRLPFVAVKIFDMIHKGTGREPTIIYKKSDFIMMMGSKSNDHVKPGKSNYDMPTDDWPFLYLPYKKIPSYYLIAMASVFCFIVLLLIIMQMVTFKEERLYQKNLLPIKISFAIMGIAFLLLETKSVLQFSLLFGTTWLNNSLVFLAVLISVLFANWIARLIKNDRFLLIIYLLLVISAMSTYFYPLSNLLKIDNIFIRFLAASIMTFSPIFFANLIFSIVFRDQAVAEHIFGWNLLGAPLGGIIEYTSMMFGYDFLTVIVTLCYTIVFIILIKAKHSIS